VIFLEQRYFSPERRNCGTGDGGFKRGNTCSSGDGSQPRGEVSKRLDSGEKPSKVMQSLGFRSMNFSGIDRELAKADGPQKARILADLDMLAEAIKIDKRLANVPIRVATMDVIYKNNPETLSMLKEATSDGGILGAVADAETMSISIFTDDEYQSPEDYADGWNSSNHPASVAIHELSHIEHYKSVIRKWPHPGQDELPGVSQLDYAMTSAESAGTKLLKSDRSLRKKVAAVSEYAKADVFEAVAEYSTAVSLGDMKNDPDLDRFCKAVGAPVPVRRLRA